MIKASALLRTWFVVLFTFFAPPLVAQESASLIADRVFFDQAGRITAEGNVTVFYQGSELRAERVVYSEAGDQLSISGPITVIQPDGNVLIAEQATLDQDLANGVLTSARLVLDQQLQLAANRISRVDGRFTTLSRVVSSSCRVCANSQTPLWDIRANRVIHDTQERQLYFEGAQFRFAGVPIFYLPRLRLPDPTLDRATGYLIPRLQTSSDLGTGIKLPYFIALGDHADLTLTPYIATKTQTLEFNLRQEIKNGRIDIQGAISEDEIEGSRGYFFGTAELRLPREFLLTGQVEFVSDAGYLFTYDYSEKDRLNNELALTRVREKDLFRASATEFRTLRESEIPIRDTLPDRYIELTYLRDIPSLKLFGGEATARIDFAALNRPSSVDVDGRDVSRIGGGVDWSRQDILGPGIVADSELGVRFDAYNVGQDSNFDTNLSRFVPRGAVELRWPFARGQSDGTVDVIQPVIRLDYANTGGQAVPLEDSRIIEFDEANLFSQTRFPGVDGAEDGARLATGVSWSRRSSAGWDLDVAVGRVASLDGNLSFSASSGLAGDQSEWLLAARLGLNESLSVSTRSLLDDNVAFTLSETRVDWAFERGGVSTTYLFAEPEPLEGRNDRLSEWSFDGSLQLNDTWTARTDWRYDFNEGRAARAGVGLDFENECLRLALSLSRRFATSTSVTPTTEFGFRVSLLGVGNGRSTAAGTGSCNG